MLEVPGSKCSHGIFFSLKFFLMKKWTKWWTRTRATTQVIPWPLAYGRRQKPMMIIRIKSDFKWWLMTSHIDISAGKWQLMTTQLFYFLGYFDFLLNLHHSGFIHRRKSVILLNLQPISENFSVSGYQPIKMTHMRIWNHHKSIQTRVPQVNWNQI